jgi:hypothetical protein
MMIGWFFDILILLTVLIWLLKFALAGYLTAEQTALFLLGFIVLLAVSRALKIGSGRLIFRVGIPIAALLAFAVTYGEGQMDQVMSILGSVFTLLLVLFGIYIMLVGPFRKK